MKERINNTTRSAQLKNSTLRNLLQINKNESFKNAAIVGKPQHKREEGGKRNIVMVFFISFFGGAVAIREYGRWFAYHNARGRMMGGTYMMVSVFVVLCRFISRFHFLVCKCMFFFFLLPPCVCVFSSSWVVVVF